jgi:hypothetical protein
MKNILICLVWIFFWNSGFCLDSTSVVIEYRKLVEDGKYASANEYLKKAVQELGFQPYLICAMVENAFENHFGHKNYISFYLINLDQNSSKNQTRNETSGKISFLRYPDELLNKMVSQHPEYALAYKLMGDFNKLILSSSETGKIENGDSKRIREEIFTNYSRAFHLQYNNVDVNRWLGDYYFSQNQANIAKEYYLKNIESGFKDTMSYFKLAKIYFQEKQFNKSYEYVTKALPNISHSEINIKHEATRIAALSLRYFGEESGFIKYIKNCIELLPDEQSCYLSLLEFYDEKQNINEIEKLTFRMLEHNPYDLEGFNYTENVIIKYNRFLLGEKVFENIILKYENMDWAMGNVYLFRGNLLFKQGMPEEAKKMWEISRNYFGKYLPEDDPIFKDIGQMSNKSLMK